MASITGPIRTLPGSKHTLPEGSMCDEHPDVLAVKRVQGETDSFGSEMMDCCQACLDEMFPPDAEPAENHCDWCSKLGVLSYCRDPDEGSCGPVYMVCPSCISNLHA